MAATENITKRLVLIGDMLVGKTALMYSFKNKRYCNDYYLPEILNKEEFIMELDGKTYMVDVRDTTGIEDYEKYHHAHNYPVADTFIVCYSISDRNSFENITLRWKKMLRETYGTVPIILVGTKQDERTSSSVSTEEGEALRTSIQAKKFIECSAMTMTNVEEIFYEALRASETKSAIGIVKKKNRWAWFSK